MKYLSAALTVLLFACNTQKQSTPAAPYVMVLGVAQDAGYPQINCNKACCKTAWQQPALRRMTACLAIVDPATKQQWIIDATPDIKNQLQLLKTKTGTEKIDGVLLTHAHMGHYTGLLHFGREAMGANNIPVYALPKMKIFLEQNGPWSQLVALQNISIQQLQADSAFNLNANITIKPFLVPHRDEFSETAGYEIIINGRSLVFIPDIDKWQKWNTDIKAVIQKATIVFLDATFFKNGELERDMREIPHPFVEESMQLFSGLSATDKAKVHFIHANHTNPLLIENSPAQKEVTEKGFNVAKEGEVIRF